MFFYNIVKFAIKDKIALEKELANLQESYSEILSKNAELIIKNSNNYKVIYNPIGESMWFINSDKTVYIQGKPLDLAGFLVDEIIVLNKNDVDFNWFNIRILPFGLKNNVVVKYL